MVVSAKTQLYPFQRDTVERAKGFDGRCLLALQQGAGKTVCAITYAMETCSFPAVIVCPASLKYNWANEFQKHYGKETVILSGTKPEKCRLLTTEGNPVYIINYDILHAWVPALLRLKPKLVVLDESQMAKHLEARRTKACVAMAYNSDRFLALSGTPMAGNPMELYPVLNMIFKGHFVSYYKFRDMYTKWFDGPYGVCITGPKNERALNEFLTNRCMIRYRVEDVLPGLPPFVRQTTLLDMTSTQRREYATMQDEFGRWLREKYPGRRIAPDASTAILAKLGYMKRQVATWKIPAIIEHVDNFIQNNDGKLIVFGLHRAILDSIWSKFQSRNKKNHPFMVRIDGSTPAERRNSAVQSFQNDPKTRVFLAQMIAAGTGLTLTASNHSLFSEVDFLPVTHTQAEARNRRIGSEASFIHYNYILMKDTIEEHVCNRLFERQRAIDTIVDGMGDDDAGSFNLVMDFISARFGDFEQTTGGK